MTTNPQAAAAETIGKRLRRLRTERGLSQRELASPGVSYAYISRIEAGTRQPSVKALRKLARKLEISPEYLETGREIGAAEARELRLADAELELRLTRNTDAAEEGAQQVLDEAGSAGDLPAAARARIVLGQAAWLRGQFDATAKQLEEVVESGLVRPTSHPDVFATLGRAYAALGKPARAVELFEYCVRQLDEDSPDNLAVRTRFATYLSYALADVGELDRAEEVVSHAVEEAEDLADPYTQVRLYWSLARLASMQGRQSTALNHARRAIALLEATEDSLHLGRAHLLAGSILTLNGNADRALKHLETAERLFGCRPEREDVASLRTEQAKAAAQLQNGGVAVERARAALELIGEDDPAERGGALSALAEGLSLQGDVQEAGRAFATAVDLLTQEGRWRDASLACRAWARMLRGAGRESEALDALERAADLAGRRESIEARVPR